MSTLASEHGVLPLAPVERPRHPFIRLVYFMTRRRYGKTPMAFRIVYARQPWIAAVSALVVFILDFRLVIPKELRYLVSVAFATRAGCTFCADLVLAEAVRSRIGRERFEGLLAFEDSSAFTEREKAALAYVAAVHESLHVPDHVHARLRAHFTEREVVEIVWVAAIERYFNGMALPLRIGSDGLAGASSGSHGLADVASGTSRT